MVTCPTCESIDVKVSSLNFARAKPEGQPTVKHIYNKYAFFCNSCQNQWESIPEAEKDYFEYVHLRDKNPIFVRDMKQGGSYGPVNTINMDELTQVTLLARKIIASYKHVLNIDPSEWHQIGLDAQINK